MAGRRVPVLLFALSALVAYSEAARRISAKEQMLRARRSVSGPDVPRDMLGLTQGEDLEETTEMSIGNGMKKVKFQETYDGVPIAGATAVLERDSSGRFTSKAVGHLVGDLSEDIPNTEPQFSVEEAFRLAAERNGDEPGDVRFDPAIDAKLEIVLEEGSSQERPHGRLVYQISYMVEGSEEVARPFMLLDALTGETIDEWNGLSVNRITEKAKSRIKREGEPRVKGDMEIDGVGGNLKIGKAEYGKNYPKLKVENSCILQNNVAKVYNCQRGWRCGYTPFTFSCEEGFDDAVNGAFSPMTDALFYISATYEMFDQWYGIKAPLRRRGTNESFCMARVHYGRNYENAFWDGTYITFGDGYRRFYPLTSINVVAHEIAHGITQMNSGLRYRQQSGGMNEAFSDMAGEAVEFFASQTQDWMVGYEIFKDPDAALRYFDDPSKDGKSIGDAREYCSDMDPHYSSGVYNRVFYYLGETEGWDVRKAFHPFVVANQFYWTEGSRFSEGACGVVEAAKDLGLNTDDVAAAFRKAGVEPCEDDRFGLAATSDLSCPAGEQLLARVDVPESMGLDHMTIKVRSHVRAEMEVRSPTCRHCAETVYAYRTKEVEICSARPGTYEVALTPERDMWATSIGFFGRSLFVLENVTLERNSGIYETSFEMPSFVTEHELQVILTLRTSYGYAKAYIRHGEPPDLINYRYDYVLYRNSNRLLCFAKPGTWYMALKTYYRATGISVELESILTGRVVKTTTTSTTTTTTTTVTTPTPTVEAPEGSGAIYV